MQFLSKLGKPSPAMVVAVVALFMALGGGAYAAVRITTSDIANGAVTHAKLAKNSVQQSNLGNGAVQLSNLSRSLAQDITKAPNPSSGSSGSTGAQGPKGDKGDKGDSGAPGGRGPQGLPGANSPLTYTFANNSSPDSGDCGNNWATDTYDSTIVVQPNNDGSYTIQKYVRGTFVTIAGAHQPNDSGCTTSQTGGVNGTFGGVETWNVPAPGGGQAASFDPTASCATCSGASSSEGQNNAFTEAFFGSGSYNGVANYDFVYHAGSNGSWVDSNTPANNTGNITG